MKKSKSKSSPQGGELKSASKDKALVVCYIQKIRELLARDEASGKKAAMLISGMLKKN